MKSKGHRETLFVVKLGPATDPKCVDRGVNDTPEKLAHIRTRSEKSGGSTRIKVNGETVWTAIRLSVAAVEKTSELIMNGG